MQTQTEHFAYTPAALAELPLLPDPPPSALHFTDEQAIAIEYRKGMATRAEARYALRISGRGGPHQTPSNCLVGGTAKWEDVETWCYGHQIPILQAMTNDAEADERDRIARDTWIPRLAKECRALIKSAIAEDATITDKQFRAVVDQWDAWTPRQRENALGAARKIGTVEDAAIRTLGKTGTSWEAVRYELFEESRRPFTKLEVIGRLQPQRNVKQEGEAETLKPLLAQNDRLIDAIANLAGVKQGKAAGK